MATGKHHTYGPRRHFKGRTAGPGGALRSHASSSKPSKTTFEACQDRPYHTEHVPGRFKVSMPRKVQRYIGTCA